MLDGIRRLVMMAGTLSMVVSCPLYAEGEHHWSHRGSTGSAKWGALESDYTTCGVGTMQSPIDIHDADAKKGDVPGSLIQTRWNNIPKEKDKEREVRGVEVNASDLLPADTTRYYTFTGSLTTPPCTEGVTWFVLNSPTSISKNEVARFGHLYPMDARPTQPANGREIRVSQ